MLRRVCAEVVIAGPGAPPGPPADRVALPDVPGVEGPMAGLLAAMRWEPRASWLLAAGHLPKLAEAALDWLLATRAPGVWATLNWCC